MFAADISAYNSFYLNNASRSVPEGEYSAKQLAKETFDGLTFQEKFSASDINRLPVGVKKEIGGVEYAVAYGKATFHKDFTELTVFVRIKIPYRDGIYHELYFAADNIRYTVEGGITGDAKIKLVEDFPLDLFGDKFSMVLKGGGVDDSGTVGDVTYATIDCEGFKELAVSAELEFSESAIVPVDANYNPVVGKTLKIPVKTTMAAWNDVLLELSMPDFAVKSLPGFSFKVEKAVLDMSASGNSSNIKFPADYSNGYLIAGYEEMWQGLYIEKLQVRFPKEFKSKESSERLMADAENLILDGAGVSGDFTFSDILTLENGDASGWPISVTDFNIKIIANKLEGVGFGGQLLLPVSEQKPLDYSASLENGGWKIGVSTAESIDFSLWGAEANLTENSQIILTQEDGKFRPEAILWGTMSVSPVEENDSNGSVAEFRGIEFRNLHLKTEDPKISVEYMGYDGDIKIAGFPATVSDIGVKTDNTSASLNFDMALNLSDKADFITEGGMSIVGKIQETDGREKWVFDKVEYDKFLVEADFKAVKLKGELAIMKNDPEYGNGFSAGMDMTVGVGKEGDIQVKANGIFGRKDDFRYWAVDGMATGFTIPVCGMNITGFGGGISNRMIQNSVPDNIFTSGVSYKPDKTKSLSLMSNMEFNIGSESTASGNAGFNIVFSQYGGLERMGMFGEAQFAKNEVKIASVADNMQKKLQGISENINSLSDNKLDELSKKKWFDTSEEIYPASATVDAAIYGKMGMDFDFLNSVYHGDIDVYVNAAGGVLRGRESNNRAGWAEMHFEPGEWYVHIGSPSNRLGLLAQVGPMNAELGGYFMLGDQIPDFPEPPGEVMNILRKSGSTYNPGSNFNGFSNGRGIAFGSDLEVSTGDITFLILFANFNAGLGFDVMLKDFGSAHCAGSSDAIGMNGWYAQGQAYSYLQGKLGIRVKLFGLNKNVVILEGATAALLKAGLPNPTWFEGVIAGNYDLLGGAVKGRFNFELNIGDQCQIVGGSGPMEGGQVIADITPSDGSGPVDVFTAPQVVFNIPLDKEINWDTDEKKMTFKAILDKFDVKKGGTVIAGTNEWNTERDVVTFETNEILPEESDITVDVAIKFQEKVNGIWQDYKENGRVVTESKNITFKSGKAPDYIPESNIAYMYPVKGQTRLYREESTTGYIKLDKWQYNILPAPSGWKQYIEFVAKDNSLNVQQSISCNASEKLISFVMPDLSLATEYDVRIVNEPVNTDMNSNITASEVTVDAGSGNDAVFTEKEASGTVMKVEEKELLAFEFGTSQYKTFADKLKAVDPYDVDWFRVNSSCVYFNNEINTIETFEIVELEGNEFTGNKSLISAEAVLSDNFFINYIDTLTYDYNNLYSSISIDRADNIPPTDGVFIPSEYLTDLQGRNYYADRTFPFYYNQFINYYNDYWSLKNKFSVAYYNGKIKYSSILASYFPTSLRKGVYEIQLQYILPGNIKGSSGNIKYDYKHE